MIFSLTFLFIFYFYFITQSRVLFGGDSPEFLTAIKTFSIPHPPGYPLYTLLGIIFDKIFFFLPYLNRINLISIFSTILTSYFIYKILTLYKIKKTIISLSILYFSFIFPIWLYSVVPEVFALNLLIISSIIYFGLLFQKTNKSNYLSYFYLSCAFGLAHHHSFIFFVIPFIIINRKFISKKFLLIFLGLLFYIYPFLASFFNPPIDWENSQSLAGLLRLITRYSYGTFKSHLTSIPNYVNQLTTLFSTLLIILAEFKPLGSFIILFGIINYYNKEKNKSIFLWLLFSYLFFLYLTNFNLAYSFSLATFERFLTPLFLILIFFLAFGINYLLKFIEEKTNNFFSIRIYLFAKLIFITIFIFYLSNHLIISFRNIKTLNNFNYYYNFSYSILKSLPKNTILSLSSDLTYFPTTYLYYVEKIRKDDVFLIFPSMLARDYYQKKIKLKYPQLIVKDSKIENFYKKNYRKFSIITERPYDFGIYLPYGYFYQFFLDKKDANKNIKKIIDFNFNFWQKELNKTFLSKNEEKILFYKSLSEYKQERFYNFYKFLKDNKMEKEIIKIKQISFLYCNKFNNNLKIELCKN